MTLTYDPDHGDILDEQGRQVASLQPGPDRDRLGRHMAAAPELVEALKPYALNYDEVAESFYRATGIMAPGKDEPIGFCGRPIEERREAWSKWIREWCAARDERARTALERAVVKP